MGKKARKPTTGRAEEPVASAGVELPERWSVQRKTELVLRLLRGEPLDAVSRDSQIPAHELESWKREERAEQSKDQPQAPRPSPVLQRPGIEPSPRAPQRTELVEVSTCLSAELAVTSWHRTARTAPEAFSIVEEFFAAVRCDFCPVAIDPAPAPTR